MKESTISLRNENIHSLEAKSATKILNNIATYEDITLMTIADSDSNEFVDMIISSLEMATKHSIEKTNTKLIEALLTRAEI